MREIKKNLMELDTGFEQVILLDLFCYSIIFEATVLFNICCMLLTVKWDTFLLKDMFEIVFYFGSSRKSHDCM